jgi:hypothetical protein
MVNSCRQVAMLPLRLLRVLVFHAFMMRRHELIYDFLGSGASGVVP